MELTQRLIYQGFLVKPHGDYRLVHTARGKFEWGADELCSRSVILDAVGHVVSAGWPKFFN